MKCLLHLYRIQRRPFLKDDRVYNIHPKSKTKEWRQSMLSLSTAETGDILQDLKKETIRTERITITSVHTCTSSKTCGIRKYVISLCHNQEDSKRFPRRRRPRALIESLMICGQKDKLPPSWQYFSVPAVRREVSGQKPPLVHAWDQWIKGFSRPRIRL